VLLRDLGLDLLALGKRRGFGRHPQALFELGLIILGLLELLLELMERELERRPIGLVPGFEGLALRDDLGLRSGLGDLDAALLLGAHTRLDVDELLVRNPLTTPGTRVLLLHRRRGHLSLQEKKGPKRTL
jgi:hypothetical protein